MFEQLTSNDLLLPYSPDSPQQKRQESCDPNYKLRDAAVRSMECIVRCFNSNAGASATTAFATAAATASNHMSLLTRVSSSISLFASSIKRPYSTSSSAGKKLDPHSLNSSVLDSPISPVRIIKDDFQYIKSKYTATKYPIILCHGLFGFDTLKSPVPVIVKDLSYWHGIKEALEAAGAVVFSASVPPVGPIEIRAKYLSQVLEKWAKETNLSTKDDDDPHQPLKVNLIGHSMGGLDARYMTSILKPPHIKVVSLTTIGTPHQGTSFADHIFDEIPLRHIGKLLKVLALVAGMEESAGIKQLTTRYMQNEFNPRVLDDPEVYYSSYGARLEPRWTNVLRYSGTYIKSKEGDNDGLVSVESAKWGEYLGTIDDCDHLDVVNLVGITHWLKWVRQQPHAFNAIALYLHIMDSLAAKGY